MRFCRATIRSVSRRVEGASQCCGRPSQRDELCTALHDLYRDSPAALSSYSIWASYSGWDSVRQCCVAQQDWIAKLAFKPWGSYNLADITEAASRPGFKCCAVWLCHHVGPSKHDLFGCALCRPSSSLALLIMACMVIVGESQSVMGL